MLGAELFSFNLISRTADYSKEQIQEMVGYVLHTDSWLPILDVLHASDKLTARLAAVLEHSYCISPAAVLEHSYAELLH